MSQVFSFQDHPVRTIIENGQPWFVAKDIALLLGYTKPDKEVRRICKHVKLFKGTNLVHLGSSPRGFLLIPEPDVWRLIIRSTLEKAQEIEAWIMGEVLPAIRQTGKYEAKPKPKKKLASLPLHGLPKALPENPANIIPIRVNFLKTRDFEKARRVVSEAATTVFNEGCLFGRKLEKLADVVDKGFDPDPDECRGASFFDTIIASHRYAMRRQANIIVDATSAFVEQCNALEAFATMLIQSDKGTELDAVKKIRFIKQDGTGVTISR